MESDERRRGTYKKYLNVENPNQLMPKTTKWRINKHMKISQESKTSTENSELAERTSDDGIYPDEISEIPAEPEGETLIASDSSHLDDMDDQHWFSPASSDENWFQINEESVWFDESDIQPQENANEKTNSESSGNADDSSVYDGAHKSVWFDESDIQPQENANEKTNSESCGNADDSSVYDGAHISVAQSAILILTFALRHNITGECFSDLLTLISLHCITTAFIHQSLYKFRTYFSSLKSPIVFHKFCVKCEQIVDGREDKCTICNSDFNDKNNISYFIEIPLLFQLQQLFSRLDFHLNLLKRFSRKKKYQGNIEDIYDGDLYKKFSKVGGFLNSENNISFMWYTDGVPLFKSSKVSVWPLFLSVNELPIQERFKQENMLFAGLWFGRSKPAMSCFLRPFHHSLKKIQDIGCDVYCSHCEKKYKC